MEHKVKRQSEEWFKLKKDISLTSSQFANAVGVGEKRPFEFLKSLVQRTEDSDAADGIGSQEDADGIQGSDTSQESVENVIREAYELLTGLHIQETGFWVPDQDGPLHSLIGASPDGLVVDMADKTRVLGLAVFKAPENDLYTSAAKCPGGIPRHCMVQVQGQMAVCGAPWCDFMAVCSKTRDIMLKRVFFQPRYWEHVATRLKLFCFAMQEAEIMRELGRDVLSGSMARRLQQQAPAPDQLFPAEDIITVENLLTNAGYGCFRGPSRKLLSFDILMGDVFPLPPSLNKYSQELLAKVDAEIRRKSGRVMNQNKSRVEAGGGGKENICKTVFHGEAFVLELARNRESPERVFEEGRGIFEGDSSRRNSLEKENREEEETTYSKDSRTSLTPVSSGATSQQQSRSGTTVGSAAPSSLLSRDRGRAKSVNLTGRQTALNTRPASTPPGRPFQTRGSVQTASSIRGHAPGTVVSSGGKTAIVSTSVTPSQQSVRGRGRGGAAALRGRGGGRGHPASSTATPSQRQNISSPSSKQGSAPITASTPTTKAGKQQAFVKARTQSPVPRKLPRLSSGVNEARAVSSKPSIAQTEHASVAVSSSSQNVSTSMFSSPASQQGKAVEKEMAEVQKSGTAAQSTTVQKSGTDVPKPMPVRSAKHEWEMAASTSVTASPQPQKSAEKESATGQISDFTAQKSVPVCGAKGEWEKAASTPVTVSITQPPQAVRSAKSEWEMSARRKPLQPRPRPLSGSDVPSEVTGTSKGESTQAQEIASVLAAFKQQSPVVSAASGNVSEAGGVEQEKRPQELTSAGDKNFSKSADEVIPPGLTLLEPEAELSSNVSDSKSLPADASAAAGRDSVSETVSTPDILSDTQSESASPQGPLNLKRPAPEQDSGPSVEKRFSGRSTSSEREQGRARSDSSDQESPRGHIHRPWLERGDNWGQRDQDRGGSRERFFERTPERSFDRPPEAHSGDRRFDFPDRPFDRPPEAHSRDRPFGRPDFMDRPFDRPPEAHSRPFDARDRGQPIPSLFDIGTNRGAPPTRPPFDRDLDRGRDFDRDQGRVFDYDHNRRIIAEDFHRRPGGPGRESMLAEIRNRDAENLRRNPSDLLQRGGPPSDAPGNRGLPGRWSEGRGDFDRVRGLLPQPAHMNFGVTPRMFGAPLHGLDRGFPGVDPRDPRGPPRGPNPDIRGELGRGAFRGFPPGRRPYEF